MNLLKKRILLPSLIATSLVSVNFIAIKPASAGDHTLRDVGIGAATGAVTGTVIHHHSTVKSAINGAAAGGVVHTLPRHRGHRDLGRDAAVGGATGAAVGLITNRRHTLNNAVDGAAAGAVLNLTTH